ncbi:unnamed protein product [Sphagnum tenellum]
MIMAGLAAADFVQAAMQNKILAVLYSVAWHTLLRVICLIQRLQRRQHTSTSDSYVETTIAACGTLDKLEVQRDPRATLMMTPEMYRKSLQSADLARINGFLARGRRFKFATGTNRQQMPAGDHCLCALCNEQLNINAAQIQATDSFSMLQTVSARVSGGRETIGADRSRAPQGKNCSSRNVKAAARVTSRNCSMARDSGVAC